MEIELKKESENVTNLPEVKRATLEEVVPEEKYESLPLVEDEKDTEDLSYLENAREQLMTLSKQATQQKFTERIEDDIKLQKDREEKVWKGVIEDRQHKELDAAYHKISPQELPFFDVLDQKKFTDQTEINFAELKERYHINVVQRWNGNEIDRMFGKGLNPTSLITSLESAEWFEKNLPRNDDCNVIEFGTGAGWGTVMLFNTLKKANPEQKIKQFSVDMSAHSIAATETLLCYSGIPYITVADGEELTQIQQWLKENPDGKDFSGVILILDKFNNVINNFQNESVNGIYSSHGTAYLSKNEYTDLLEKSSKILKKDGIFISDSLNPLYTNKLDTLFTLRQIIDPYGMQKSLDKKQIEYVFGKEKIKNNSKYFLNQDVQILKGFNTEEAYLILRWCNHLLKNFELNRLFKTVKSLSVTMKVVDEYRADVFPSFLLEDLIKQENLKFDKLEGRPNFPIFMDTQGFRLTEK